VYKKALTNLIAIGGFFFLIAIVRDWFESRYLLFWVGGLAGIFLPDVDHLVYVYFKRPHELTSQRAKLLFEKRRLLRIAELLYSTGQERKSLIFHTALFQLAFLAFAFFVISSSGSLFGRGLVLGFLLHILIEQLNELMRFENIDRWLASINLRLNKNQAALYWFVNLLTVILLGFLF